MDNKTDTDKLYKTIAGKLGGGTPDALQKPNGDLVFKLEQKLEVAANHFRIKSKNPTVLPKGAPLGEEKSKIMHLNDVFTDEEFEIAIKSLKNGKASGLDGIAPELIKYGGFKIIQSLTDIANYMLKRSVVPKTFKTARIKVLYKKGFEYDLDNYRPIALQSCLGKVIFNVINKRIPTCEITNKMQK